MFLLGIAEGMWHQKHCVSYFTKRERINGRFTGAKITYFEYDNGSIGTGSLFAFLIIFPIVFIPMTILTIFI